MADVINIKPKVKTITLNDGVEREVKFTLNAMAEIEDKYGSVDAGFAELDKGSIKAARFILWAGFLHLEDASLTEQRVGNLIDMECLNSIFEQMGEALTADMPAQVDGGDNALPNA